MVCFYDLTFIYTHIIITNCNNTHDEIIQEGETLTDKIKCNFTPQQK
jgi:hypothetical protein